MSVGPLGPNMEEVERNQKETLNSRNPGVPWNYLVVTSEVKLKNSSIHPTHSCTVRYRHLRVITSAAHEGTRQ